MRRSLAFALLLLIAGAGMACRELASPMADLEERRAVGGTLTRADKVPVWGAHISFKPYSSVFSGQFGASVIVDEEGRFSFEAPDILLSAKIVPPIGSGVPPRLLEPVEFSEGSDLNIVLPGFAVRGQLTDPSDGLTNRSQTLYLRSELDEPVFGIGYVMEFAQVDEKGRFEAYCHAGGSYEIAFQQHRGAYDESYMEITEVLRIDEGDSLALILPLIPVEVEWLLAGEPLDVPTDVPVVSFATEEGGLRPQSAYRHSTALTPTRHRLFVLRGTDYLHPRWSHGSVRVIHQVSPFGPVQPGQILSHELGAHELLLGAEDEQGGATAGPIRVTLRTAEIPLPPLIFQRVYILDPGAQLQFRMNDGGYRLGMTSQDGLYLDHAQDLMITGDLQLTVPLTPTP